MTAVCARCQAVLAPDVLEGLCPRCLLLQAIQLERIKQTTTPLAAFKAPAVADLARLFPQLEILELLGQGGMGAVYKARQVKLDRLVALKVLPPGSTNDISFAERFVREARALARLNHPSITGVHDFGEVNGLYYLVMEYVDGVNLRQTLTAGKLEPRQALATICELCSAMQYAHEMGVVHRDIKPENILLDRHGRVKVADFGLAKLIGANHPNDRLTAARHAMGTPHYMAPEQWERPLEVDHRADVYSLGIVFYEMLTGELPLGKFPLPSQKAEVDSRVDDVVLHAIEKEPKQRFQKMSEMKSAVEGATDTPGASGLGRKWGALIEGLIGVQRFFEGFGSHRSCETVPGLEPKEEALCKLLSKFQDELSGEYSVFPDIDATLLGTLRRRCRAAPEDRILAVLDFSDGEGESGLLFGSTALYWRNDEDTPHPGTGVLRYADMVGRRFVNHGDAVWLGKDQFICPRPEDTGIDSEELVSVLNKLRDRLAERRD
jgi:tRNA A-37 threonylcarbamoyl transferase component Bud32